MDKCVYLTEDNPRRLRMMRRKAWKLLTQEWLLASGITKLF